MAMVLSPMFLSPFYVDGLNGDWFYRNISSLQKESYSYSLAAGSRNTSSTLVIELNTTPNSTTSQPERKRTQGLIKVYLV